MKVILRSHEGLFDHTTEISIQEIINKTKLSETKVIELLSKLHKVEVIQFESSKTDAKITFIEPREDDKTIHRISKIIKQQQALKRRQLQDMDNEGGWVISLRYYKARPLMHSFEPFAPNE